MFIDPEILQKELVISLPLLNDADIQMILNGVNSSSEESSSSSSLSSSSLSVDDEKEKPCRKRDQRRFNLLNNPNYGVILCFMQKFRSYINLKNYPLRIFEDNLISEKEKISGRFMDFHLALLKKISPGKFIERNQFVSNMTKFAYRFNRDDGEHLEEYGYSKARIDTKLRILKNLLEQQFDRNHPLKTAVADKPSFDIHSKPFGRDRFGASYWLFTDTDCFLRLFRENIDTNRTWINLAKSPKELENAIKVLITDYIVRKKFPEWKFSYESFNDLSSSKKFEEDYGPSLLDIKEKNEITEERSPSSVVFGSSFIQTQHINLEPIVNLDRDLSSSPPLSSFSMDNIKIKNILDITSDQESIISEVINANRLRISSSSNDTKDEIYSRGFSPESNEKEEHKKSTNNNNAQVILLKPSTEQGIKRKLVDYDDTESENESEKNENINQIPANEESKNNADLPIALRRSRRGGRSALAELSPDSSSTSKSFSQSSTKKKFTNGKWKNSNQSSKTNARRRRRGHGGRKSKNELSSTTSDERQPSDDDDDFSEDYFPNNTELDKLLNGDLLDEEEEEDDDDDYSPRRTAKTVAQLHEQFQIQLKPCSICSQTDRPELLLLCEDCNDAYHLECVKPELFSIPDDEWYCPLCEHKRLCDGLIEKLIIFIKDEAEFEMKHRLCVSKRRNRLTNVTVNLERYVGQPPNKQQTKRIISSDDDKESEKKTNSTIDDDKESEKKTNSTIDDDDDSVYGCKNDENRKPSGEEEQQQTGKRRVRSCRRKPQNYSFDDYDKKIKDAMINAGIHKELIEIDSDDSDDMILKRRPPKKRARYEQDDDFDISDGKNGDADFLPRRRRTVNDDSRTMNDDSRTMNDDSRTMNDDSRSDPRDNNDYDDIGMSDDDSAWRNRRQSSASSISKKKSNSKANRKNHRKPPVISDEDTILYDPNANDSSTAINVKAEPTIEFEKTDFTNNVFGKNELVKNVYDKNKVVENVVYTNEAANINKPRRPRRAAATKKKKQSIQEEKISDEEENGRPPPSRRLPNKKRRGSNDSSLDDDDDYEKLVHKRRLFHHGKAITRTSITKHIKKLVGDDDDDDEEEEDGEGEKTKEGEENGEGSTKDKSSNGTKKDDNNNSKQKNKNLQDDEVQLSDDDDFPDEQEILKTTGLLNLKKPFIGPKPVPFQPPFMPLVQSYQFAMVDPTAQFEFTCPPEAPMTEPSDSSQANGDHSLSATT